MTDQNHLSVIANDPSLTSGDSDGGGAATTRHRQPARPRPKLKLPTERLTLEKQVAALNAFVRASERGAYGVGAKQIAPRMSVSEDTAGLVNNFFVEAGFLTKAGKGRYKPVPEAVQFEREASFRKPDASKILAVLLRDKWYFTAIQPELAGGRSVAPDVLIGILAATAGVGSEREPQLAMILEWLEYVGLIEQAEDGKVRLGRSGGSGIPAGKPDGDASITEELVAAALTPPDNAGAKGQEPTLIGAEAPTVLNAANVLAFKFEFSLTADDLRKMTPDQIAATFEAVGKVIAIKAEAGIE